MGGRFVRVCIRKLTTGDQGGVMEEQRFREKRAAVAKAAKYQYSPAFITADDAARYVHERIGNKRDVEYGSVILQRLSDQRIYATQPIPGKAATFDFELLLERGAGNSFVEPPGYKLVGGIHSHPQQFDFLKRSNPRYTDRQVRVFNDFFSERDVVFNHYEGRSLVTAYLSGPNGTLLKYQPSFSEAERQFVDWLDDVKTALPAHGHDGTLEGYIKKLASLGRLSLLLASDDWGGAAGLIDQSWQPYLPLVEPQGTVACGPLFKDVTKALNAAQVRMRRKPELRQMTMLLKHEQRSEFVATQALALGAAELVPADNRLPSLAGGPLLPEGFHVHGFFYLSQPVLAQTPRIEPWLYQQFFSPGELAAYIAKARRYQQAPTSALGISLYLRTKDDALLRYRFSGSPAETQLFKVDDAGGVSDQGIQQALERGTLTPAQFVARVAAAGELSVEKTSALWDVEGVVENNWTPFASFPQKALTLSQPFASADEAALYAHAQVGGRRGREYGALILKQADHRYVLTQQLETPGNPYAFQGFYPWEPYSRQLALPDGYQLHAWFGSHVASSLLNLDAQARANWSSDEVDVYAQGFTAEEVYRIHQLQVPGYLSGAKDSLIVLDTRGAKSSEFLGFFEAPRGGSLVARNLADGTYKPADAIRTLAEVSHLRVVKGNSLWGPAGSIDKQWVPFKGRATPGTTVPLPALSPAFIQADDAALWAHRRIGARRDREYGGVILRNLQGYFFATEPVSGQALEFDIRDVLSTREDGSFLPIAGYRRAALYHSHPADYQQVASANPDMSEQQVRVHLNFFSPWDAAGDIAFQHNFALSYLSGPDDSLVRYRPSGSFAEAQYAKWILGTVSDAQWGTDGSLEGHLKKLLALGELSFVTSNPLWGGSRGVVPQNWELYRAFAAPAPGLLPLLSHVCATVSDAIAAGVALGTGPGTAWRLGLVLKRDGKDEFVATQAQVLGEPRFYVNHLLSTDADGNYLLPDEHRIVGFYCESPAERSRLAMHQPWLYRSFFAPQALDSAAQQAGLIANLQVPEQPLGLYQQTAGGALLRYRFGFSTAETELFGSSSEADSALLKGSLTPQEYVLQVAAVGELTVLATNRMWDRAGVVTAAWRPYVDIPLVTVGPAFTQPDDAARWAHNQIGTRRDKEYGGLILKRGNRYFATHPGSGAHAMFDFYTILAADEQDNFIAPHGYECHALYHSHPADAGQIRQLNPGFTDDQVELFNSFYSNADQVFVITHRHFARVHYLSGAVNSLLKYVSSGSAEETNLEAQLTGTQAVVPFTAFEGAVWRLAQAGELHVVVPSPVWGGVRGKVPQGWTLRSPVNSGGAAQAQPFFTPMLSTAQAAVLVALSATAGLRQTGYQGVVLKHLTALTYIATEPTALGPSLTGLFPLRNNGQPRLPSNYRLVGFYYSPAPMADAPLPATEPWLYKRFVSPQLLVTAMNQAAGTQSLQIADLGLKLFLHTSDRALLQWQAPDAKAATELFSVATDGTVTDNGNQAALMDGSLSPRAFVRRVIRAGELTVLQVGQLWTQRGLLYDRETLPLGAKHYSIDATFLSADDAARHAHERIGVRRDMAFGGYILRLPDQRFAFTEPVRVQGDGFAGDLLLSLADNGLLVPSADHVIHGRYASHAPLSQAELERWRRLGWTLTDLEVSASMFSDQEIRSAILSGLPAYLSGTPNNLICYQPSGSQKEALVLANTRREPGVDNYRLRLERGALKPQDIVTRVADAGELRVLAHTRLWGPRLRVYDDWTPNFEYAEVAPQTPSLSAIFSSPDAAAINAHKRGYGRNLAAQGCTAYLLKHPQKSEYVVSELAPEASNAWLSDSSIGAAYLEGGGFAHGFVLAGMFYSQQWLPSGLPSTEAWLARFFATPQLMQRAEKDARSLPRAGSSDVLPVYLSTLEGALLRYQPPATSLFSGGGNGDEVSVQGMSLSSGTLDIRRYVSLMAKTGDLTVLYSSQCWDRRGPVSKEPSQWRPYAHFIRRRLGPVFNEQDDAARYARSRLPASNGGRLFGGLILKRPDGLFVATEPVSVPREDFEHTWIFPDEMVAVGGFPAAHTLVARYRSSPGRELPFTLDATQRDIYRNMLSTRVISAVLNTAHANLSREYLFGADASIISYSRSDSALETALKNDLQPLNPVREDRLENKLEQQIRAGELTPEAFVQRLSKAGRLRVVDGSEVWGPPRLLQAFVPNAYRAPGILIENALADPAFSPVFAQRSAAVRYAHERCQYGPQLQFGYVFKDARKEQYMVTMPLVRASYWKFGQVFPSGLLPQGYVLEDLYLCAALETLTPGQDPHARMIHSPLDIDSGIRFARHGVKGKQLGLYLSCPDGALLRYQYLQSDEELDSRSHFPMLRQQLHEGKITLLEYVQELARLGNLDVMVEGSVWGGTRRISPDWRPGAGEGFFDFPMLCGPLFSHADDAARYVQRRLLTRGGHNYVAAVLANPNNSSFIATLPLWPGLDATRLFRLFYTGRSGPVQPISQPASGPIPYPDFPVLYRVVGAQLAYRDSAPVDSADSRDEVLISNFMEPSFLAYFIRVLKAQSETTTSLYLVSRGGALLKYVPGFSPLENQLMATVASLTPLEFLQRLTGVGQLSVLDRDTYWHNEGLISEVQKDSRNGVQTDAPLIDEPLQLRDRDEL